LRWARAPGAYGTLGFEGLPKHLTGDKYYFYGVFVRANWRIIFRFEGTDAFDVELIDYH